MQNFTSLGQDCKYQMTTTLKSSQTPNKPCIFSGARRRRHKRDSQTVALFLRGDVRRRVVKRLGRTRSRSFLRDRDCKHPNFVIVR